MPFVVRLQSAAFAAFSLRACAAHYLPESMTKATNSSTSTLPLPSLSMLASTVAAVSSSIGVPILVRMLISSSCERKPCCSERSQFTSVANHNAARYLYACTYVAVLVKHAEGEPQFLDRIAWRAIRHHLCELVKADVAVSCRQARAKVRRATTCAKVASSSSPAHEPTVVCVHLGKSSLQLLLRGVEASRVQHGGKLVAVDDAIAVRVEQLKRHLKVRPLLLRQLRTQRALRGARHARGCTRERNTGCERGSGNQIRPMGGRARTRQARPTHLCLLCFGSLGHDLMRS